MKTVTYMERHTGRQVTKTYYTLPIGDLRQLATEKGLTFDYKPSDITVYQDGRTVGLCDSREGLSHFIDVW